MALCNSVTVGKIPAYLLRNNQGANLMLRVWAHKLEILLMAVTFTEADEAEFARHLVASALHKPRS